MIIDETPHNPDIEDAVLGTAIRSAEYAKGLFSTLTERHFYQNRAKTLLRHIQAILTSDGSITHELLWDSLKRSSDDKVCPITYLLDVELCADVYGTQHINLLYDYANRRDAISLGYRMIEFSRSMDGDHKESILRAMADIQSIGSGEGITGPEHISSILSRVFTTFETQNSTGLAGLSCGIEEVDRVLGGLCRGDFVIVAGRPSMGKTSFAECIASSVSRSNSVVIFSQEMAATKLALRDLARNTGVQMSQLQANSFPRSELPNLVSAAGNSALLNLWIDDSSGVSLSDITQRIRAMKKDVALVIIDYIQLMRTNEKRGMNREQAISEVSRGLKAIARANNTCVVALSQLSREVERREDKRPMLSDLRESGSLEQDSDIVLFLYRDEYYNQESEAKGQAEVIVAKNRNGPVGLVPVDFDAQRMRFRGRRVMI